VSLEQTSKKLLVVVSFMPGNGPTGVETHFNLIMAHAIKIGMQTKLVTPHNTNWLLRKFPNVLIRLLSKCNIEYSMLLGRVISSSRLRSELKRVVNQNPSHEIIFYAQCPLSAAAALAIRKNIVHRVVSVCHFNVSEANEMVEKSLIAEGGRLWRDIMRTEKETLPAVDKLMFVSKFVSDIVNKRLTLQNSQQLVIPNFPAEPQAITKDYENITGDLIAIGTLEDRKNQSYLLHVLAACNLKGKKYRLTLVGDGEDRGDLEQLASALKLQQQVNFLGFVKNASPLIANHRLLVHAAKMENMPIALIEALSYARPVIAAAVGGIPEVITEGVNGYFWNLEDVKGGADILITLLDNPKLLQNTSYQAGQIFQQKFHPDVLANKWLAAIKGDAACEASK
jgi:glycosyltransferase involved in cell wall biosynthesis